VSRNNRKHRNRKGQQRMEQRQSTPLPGREFPTRERIAHAGPDGVEFIESTKGQRIVAAPLDRLWKDGRITQREWSAGDRYRSDVHVAGVDRGAPSVDWNRAGGSSSVSGTPSMFAAQSIADARLRYRETERSIPQRSRVAVVLFLALIREMGFAEIGESVFGITDRRDATSTGRAACQMALASLADHYGM
jgi:hypothetical protein